MSPFRTLTGDIPLHLFIGFLSAGPLLFSRFVIASPVLASHADLILSRQNWIDGNSFIPGDGLPANLNAPAFAIPSDQAIPTLDVGLLPDPGWTGGNEVISSSGIVNGQTGVNNQPNPVAQPAAGGDTIQLASSGDQFGTSLTAENVSDYPTDAEIEQAFRGIGPDQAVMFSEIGASTAAADFAHMNNGKLYEDLFPVDYTIRNGRSKEWHGDFLDRLCRLFAERSSGTVFLISKWPDGPCSIRSVWARIEFPVLKGNKDVTSVLLVDYLNFSRRKVFWARSSQSKRDDLALLQGVNDQDSCFIDIPAPPNYPSIPPLGGLVDLTPVLGAAAGWARVHVVQLKASKPGIYQLDISIINARDITIGQVMDANAPAGQEVRVVSKIPFAVRVIAPSRDEDPLGFRYGQDSWDSNDRSEGHQCMFSTWKDDGTREGDCIFTY